MPAFRRRLLFRLAASDSYERLVRALPPIAAAARRRALRYVAGETVDDTFAVARTLHAHGLRAAIDFFGDAYRRLARSLRAAGARVTLATHDAALRDGPARRARPDAGGDAARGPARGPRAAARARRRLSHP